MKKVSSNQTHRTFIKATMSSVGMVALPALLSADMLAMNPRPKTAIGSIGNIPSWMIAAGNESQKVFSQAGKECGVKR